MRFRVEPGPRGNWRVMLEGADAPVSEHDTEEEARERVQAYVRGAMAAAAPTAETGVARGDRATLSDGTEVIVRPIAPEDAPLLLEGFAQRFGEQSRYQRFLAAKRQLSPRELEYFTDVDHDAHEAIGALDPVSGAGIGIARFVRDAPGGTSAEAAVAVADDWQGRGLGGLLLERLSERARAIGVTEFTASLLTANRAMLALFERLGEMQVTHDSGTTARLTVCLSTHGDALRCALRAAAAGDVKP
jgi:GNAT superfamily N-acetyltransferase